MSTSRPGPSFSRFIVTGAIIGFIAGGVASLTGAPAPGYGEGAAVAYLGIFGAAIGAIFLIGMGELLRQAGVE